jgi:hypothetical protein
MGLSARPFLSTISSSVKHSGSRKKASMQSRASTPINSGGSMLLIYVFARLVLIDLAESQPVSSFNRLKCFNLSLLLVYRGTIGQGQTNLIAEHIFHLFNNRAIKIMPPTRRIHASTPVDKYFPSDSLVIGKYPPLILPSYQHPSLPPPYLSPSPNTPHPPSNNKP